MIQAYKYGIDQYLKHIFKEHSPMETIGCFQDDSIQMKSVHYQ